MSSNESLRQFLDALIAVGVQRADVERAAAGAQSAAALGVTLLQRGLVTSERLQAAQQRWASQQKPVRSVRRLGRYEIERRLGAGAAGEVYLVRDPATGVHFAAKRLIDLGDMEERLRFQREAQLLAQLDHPHLAKIHAAELEGPLPYFVLDYYAGGTLREQLDKGPLGEQATRALVAKLASALEAAHAVNVLHRDLKPENVLLDERGEPRLADFGLGLQLTAHSNRLTQTGTVMGTPSYMAPEQIQDVKRVDQRSDVYGLGGVLFHCLTGRPPVLAQGSLIQTLCAVVQGQVPKPSSLAEVSPQLEAICLRALEKGPAQRFPTVAAFREALTGEATVLPQPHALHYLMFSAFLALAAVLGLAFAASRSATPIVQGSASESPASGDVRGAGADEAQLAQERAAALGAIEGALDSGELRAAWEGLLVLGDGPDVVPLALRLLDAVEDWDALSEGQVDREDEVVWRELWEVSAGCQTLDSTRFVNAYGEEKDELVLLVDSVVRLCNDLSRRTPRHQIADALFLRAIDACHRAYLGLRISDNWFVEVGIHLDPGAFPESALAQQVQVDLVQLENWRLRNEKGIARASDPELRREALDRLVELRRELDELWVDRWPLLLAGKLLVSTPRGGLPMNLVRRWFARAEQLSSPPAEFPRPHGSFADMCRELAYHCLYSGSASTSPDLGLAQGVERVGDSLEGKKAGIKAATLKLSVGDVDGAARILESVPVDENSAFVFAAVEIERARRRPVGGRAEHLGGAHALLRLVSRTRARWAARQHISLLSRGEGEPVDLPEGRWKGQAKESGLSVGTPPWYEHYTPEYRFPCEDENARPLLWLPE